MILNVKKKALLTEARPKWEQGHSAKEITKKHNYIVLGVASEYSNSYTQRIRRRILHITTLTVYYIMDGFILQGNQLVLIKTLKYYLSQYRQNLSFVFYI